MHPLGVSSSLARRLYETDGPTVLTIGAITDGEHLKRSGTTIISEAAGGESAKGWVHFDGTGTLSIGDSFNVTSVTDNSTGNYTVNWDTDFATADYAVVWTVERVSNGGWFDIMCISAQAAGTTQAIWIATDATFNTAADFALNSVIAHGDQ